MRTIITAGLFALFAGRPLAAQGPQVATTASRDTTRAAVSGLPALAQAIDSLARHVDSLKKELAGLDRRAQEQVKGLGNFHFAGDLRLRYEPTFQSGTPSRHRERSRARLHVTGKVGGALSGGISLTTGAANEPQAEFQTSTGFFTRKSVGFERFFLTWRPAALPGLSVTAGKFPIPWTRTGLTFAADVHPEGAAIAWHAGRAGGVLEDVTVVAALLPLLELANDADGLLTGGQVQARWRLGRSTRLQTAITRLHWSGTDQIAVAVDQGALKPILPQSNSLRTDAQGKVIGFGSGFRYVDAIVQLEQRFSARWPLVLQADVTRNDRAAAGRRLGWLAEARLGAIARPGQWQVALGGYRIERDAVISAFNFTDFRLGTNATGQTAQLVVRAAPEMTATLSGYRGRMLDAAATASQLPAARRAACAAGGACRDPWMTRFQLDLNYTF